MVWYCFVEVSPFFFAPNTWPLRAFLNLACLQCCWSKGSKRYQTSRHQHDQHRQFILSCVHGFKKQCLIIIWGLALRSWLLSTDPIPGLRPKMQKKRPKDGLWPHRENGRKMAEKWENWPKNGSKMGKCPTLAILAGGPKCGLYEAIKIARLASQEHQRFRLNDLCLQIVFHWNFAKRACNKIWLIWVQRAEKLFSL